MERRNGEIFPKSATVMLQSLENWAANILQCQFCENPHRPWRECFFQNVSTHQRESDPQMNTQRIPNITKPPHLSARKKGMTRRHRVPRQIYLRPLLSQAICGTENMTSAFCSSRIECRAQLAINMEASTNKSANVQLNAGGM